MKFIVTAVPISRATRRRVGKARTEIIDTSLCAPCFAGLKDPVEVERAFEAHWNDAEPTSRDIIKVVDVREVK